MKILLLFLSFVVCNITFASDNSQHCLCVTGKNPKSQQIFFKLGCQQWLNQQPNCETKDITEMSDFMMQDKKAYNLPIEARNGLLKVGYVGHWANAASSLGYLVKVIAPTAKKYNVDIEVDNTACRGTDDPEFLSEIIKSSAKLFPRNNKITYKSNQVDSIGLWDQFGMPDSYNFWASVEIPSGKINYPNCSEFLEQPCSKKLHVGFNATCKNGQTTARLYCCKDENKKHNWSYSEACENNVLN